MGHGGRWGAPAGGLESRDRVSAPQFAGAEDKRVRWRPLDPERPTAADWGESGCQAAYAVLDPELVRPCREDDVGDAGAT